LFLNAKGKRITRFGIGYLIKEYVAKATKKCPSLTNKSVSTHTFRHTIALHLIQSGVDITVVKEWLGHASIKTTSLYIEINIEMKRKALEACPSPTTSPEIEEKLPEWHNAPVLVFLQQLSQKAALC
jgi:site-specific recombinase XerD